MEDTGPLRILPPVTEGFVELDVSDHLSHSCVLFTAHHSIKVNISFSKNEQI